MNISISLFKTKGFTKEEVEAAQKGLYDTCEKLEKSVKNLQGTVRKTERDVSFWKDQLRIRHPKKKCTSCKREIEVWPFNYTVAYYIKGSRVRHVKCPTREGGK